MNVSVMTTMYFILLFCISLHCAASFKTQEVYVTDDVTDPIASHPIIKQLMSRVAYLEERDRYNTELIGKLQSELDTYKMDLHGQPEDDTDDVRPIDGANNVSENEHTAAANGVSSGSAEVRTINESKQKKNSHERIRQTEGATVAFFATSTTKDLHIGPNQNVHFESVVTNIGNGFNSHQGLFIAPIPGTYVFFSTVLADNNAEVWTHFAVNGKNIANFYARGTDGRHDSGSQMIIVALNNGDDVSVQSNVADESIYGGEYTTFSGFLLSNTATEIIG